VVAVVLVWAAAGMAAADDTGFEVTHADAATVERLLEQTGADRRPPGPDVLAYLNAISTAVGDWILEKALADPFVLEAMFQGAGWLGVALIAVALALLVMALLRQRRRQPRVQPDVDGRVAGQERVVETVDAAAWWPLVEQSLARGSTAAGLRALWWWLARALAGVDAEASWTGRDLLRRAGREELDGLVQRLETLIYGPEPATVADVRGLAAALREAVT
jgi:hypothetical protein